MRDVGHEGGNVKYLLLIYNNPGRPPTGPEFEELVHGHAALHRELAEAGVIISSASLAEPDRATTVQVRESVPAVTDGPFLETKEHLAGYYLVDCSPEQALDIAARIPCGAAGGVEIRPVDETVTEAVRGAS